MEHKDTPAIKERRNLFLVSESNENFNNFQFMSNIEKREVKSARSSLLESPPPISSRKLLYSSNFSNSSNFETSPSPSSETGIFIRGIFNFENNSVDIELTNDNILRWKPVRKKAYSHMIPLDKFYSVEAHISHKQNVKKSLNDSINTKDEINNYDGFVLHMFEKQKPNVYKNKSLIFEHPHHNTSKEWIEKLINRMPREKRTRSIFNFQISVYLTAAQIEWDLIEFHDNQPIRDTILKNDIYFNDYYGIVVIAGDDSINKLINVLIEITANREKIVNFEELKECIKSPLCLIPVGTTNMIANTLYGTTDICTPLMHLIYGNTTRIDLSAVFTNIDKIHSFGFSFSCGLGTTLARYFKQFNKLGSNKVQTALTKAITKQKHRPIEIEIKYIKNKTHQPCDENLCVKNCKICMNEIKNINAIRTVDKVEEFDSIANSIDEIYQNLSNTINYNKPNFNNWEIISGQFIHVAFLTNSTQWNVSPGGGLSKYAHLADGYIDLILVDQITRKELYRFAKRHANYKNQLTLPFVKSIRIKEAKIKILNSDYMVPKTNQFDNSYFLTSERHEKTFVNYNELDDENNENLNSPINRVGSFSLNNKKAGQNIYFIKNRNDMNASQFFETSEHSFSIAKKSSSIINIFKSKKKIKENIDLNQEKTNYPGETSQTSKNDKNPSIWNCDWNLNNIREMHIKCFRQFLPVFGWGLDPETEFESSGNCLPGF